jgi:acyl-CoA thioesterase
MSEILTGGVFVRLGMERLIDVGKDGRAVLECRATPEICHSGGVVQGGFITGWIDAAMAYATMAASEFTLSPLSLEIKISFLRPAGPGLYHAEAWVERMGRSTAFLEGRLLNEAGEVVAKGTSMAKLIKMSKEELR